jgi:hypothetical protein
MEGVRRSPTNAASQHAEEKEEEEVNIRKGQMRGRKVKRLRHQRENSPFNFNWPLVFVGSNSIFLPK